MTKQQMDKAIRLANQVNTLLKELNATIPSNTSTDELISMGVKHLYNAEYSARNLVYRLEEHAKAE